MIADGDLRVRRATLDDLDFIAELVSHDDVEPFLGGAAAKTPDALRGELERQDADPLAFGRFVIELQEDGAWVRAGLMGFHRTSERSRTAHLEKLAVHPGFRGRRVADRAARLFQRHLIRDLGYHRLEMVVYGFNERALAHAERAGWVREGVKRRAYLRHGDWVDGVMYAVLDEDLEE